MVRARRRALSTDAGVVSRMSAVSAAEKPSRREAQWLFPPREVPGAWSASGRARDPPGTLVVPGFETGSLFVPMRELIAALGTVWLEISVLSACKRLVITAQTGCAVPGSKFLGILVATGG